MSLLLVPTAKEAAGIARAAGLSSEQIHLCGFGPVVAAARAMALIAATKPSQVYLAGIAGTYIPERHPLGTALVFGSVALDGLGAGTGPDFLPATAMGFPQWPGDVTTPAIAERLPLATAGGELLTVVAASGDAAHAAVRVARFPHAVAEDMEGFGVAVACALSGVPLTIVRGVSNPAGDRRIAHWQIGPALEAAGKLLRAQLPSA